MWHWCRVKVFNLPFEPSFPLPRGEKEPEGPARGDRADICS